jgi:Holliday junction resolvase RusA-like endonuclease
MSTFSNFIRSDSATGSSIAFTVTGDPPIQQRPRVSWKSRSKPVVYDASASEKAKWKSSLRLFLQEHGVTQFPVFSTMAPTKGMKVNVSFHFKHPKSDYQKNGELLARANQFPAIKDIDNLLKFVMDAMEGVVYVNDKVVDHVEARKMFVKDEDENLVGYTDVIIYQLF